MVLKEFWVLLALWVLHHCRLHYQLHALLLHHPDGRSTRRGGADRHEPHIHSTGQRKRHFHFTQSCLSSMAYPTHPSLSPPFLTIILPPSQSPSYPHSHPPTPHCHPPIPHCHPPTPHCHPPTITVPPPIQIQNSLQSATVPLPQTSLSPEDRQSS